MNKKKQKCDDDEEEPLKRVESKSKSNATETETDSSSLIPNSQDSVNISENNVVPGKRQRKPRKF